LAADYKWGDHYLDSNIFDFRARAVRVRKQNVMADPPFSKLNLICCRNVLIYLAPWRNVRVIETFHYALIPVASVLGESNGGRTYRAVSGGDKKQKIYSRKTTATLPYLHQAADPQAGKATLAHRPTSRRPGRVSAGSRPPGAGRYAPVGVLINDTSTSCNFAAHGPVSVAAGR